LLVFAAIFGCLIVGSDGLPFVMDSNEVFSSLVHAENTHHFGVAKSFGLADEAYGPNANGHPYIHSHQGNFPRLFAWLIYEVGARTPQSQIIATTLTVGLATVVLMFSFFSKVSSPRFAWVLCTVFMSDYLLFAQWQVVTYRVWYGFLLFLLLFSIEESLTPAAKKRWLVACGAATASLLYFELVFAAFAGLFGLIWLLLRSYLTGVKAARALQIAACLATGAVVGVAIFIVQAIAYFGWADFVYDMNITFVARNDAASDPKLLSVVVKFYESRHAIFWHNFENRESFTGAMPFIRSFTAFDWQTHTPLLSVVLCVPLLAQWAGMLPTRGSNRFLDHPVVRALRPLLILLPYLALCAGSFFVILSLSAFVSGPPLTHASILAFGTMKVAGVALAAFAFAALLASGLQEGQLLPAALLVCGISALLAGAGYLFDSAYRPLWQLLGGIFGGYGGMVLLMTTLAGSIGSLAMRNCAAGGQAMSFRLAGPYQYIGAGLLAYTIVYFLSPGYVYSGYLARLAPFTVFITDAIVAVAICILAGTAVSLVRELGSNAYLGILVRPRHGRRSDHWESWPDRFHDLNMAIVAYCAVGALLAVIAYWGAMQWSLVRLIPTEHYAFLNRLGTPPFRGASFVVNNYAAPVTVYTGQWAYMDSEISQAPTILHEGKLRLLGDRRYLWLADRDTNRDYRRPDYFLCMIPQSPGSLLGFIQRIRGKGEGQPGCSDLPLVKLAADPTHPIPGLSLVEIDAEGPSRIGFASWAIVKFDWNAGLGELIWKQEIESASGEKLRKP
jgi:hypothetical protein